MQNWHDVDALSALVYCLKMSCFGVTKFALISSLY